MADINPYKAPQQSSNAKTSTDKKRSGISGESLEVLRGTTFPIYFLAVLAAFGTLVVLFQFYLGMTTIMAGDMEWSPTGKLATVLKLVVAPIYAFLAYILWNYANKLKCVANDEASETENMFVWQRRVWRVGAAVIVFWILSAFALAVGDVLLWR